MTYRWGETEVSELTYVPITLTKPWKPGQQHGVIHFPTRLRLMSVPTLVETRGYEQDFFLYGPKEEGWIARVSTDNAGSSVTTRLLANLGMTSRDFSRLPSEERHALQVAFLKTHGNEFECQSVRPEKASPPILWSVDRRDALVMMLFFSLEYGHHEYGPFPSVLTLRATGLPAELQGKFKNQIWQQLQQS